MPKSSSREQLQLLVAGTPAPAMTRQASPKQKPAPTQPPDSVHAIAAEHAVALHAPILAGYLDKSGALVYINPRLQRWLGDDAAGCVGARVDALFAGNEIDRDALVGAALSGRESSVEIVHAQTGDVYEISLIPDLAKDGEVRGVALYGVDITAINAAHRMLIDATQRERQFIRDILAAVTAGKLLLCACEADLPGALPEGVSQTHLTEPIDLRAVRKSVRHACVEIGFSDEREMSFISAVGEAAMNALQHCGGGEVYITKNTASGAIQVRVVDQGGGISLSNLPRAALERGFSTGGTLGYGLWMILNMADHVWLLTGSAGTTIVLEHDLHEPEIKWL